MSTKKLLQEISSLQHDLETEQMEHAKWHINDLIKRLKKELTQ